MKKIAYSITQLKKKENFTQSDIGYMTDEDIRFCLLRSTRMSGTTSWLQRVTFIMHFLTFGTRTLNAIQNLAQ